MKRVMAVAAGIFLSASLIAAAHAAPGEGPKNPKNQQGLKNWKKASLAKNDRDQKVRAVKRKGYVMRQQSQQANRSLETAK